MEYACDLRALGYCGISERRAAVGSTHRHRLERKPDGYLALSRYTPSRGFTLTLSPSPTNSGTWIVTPLLSLAGLVLAVLVAVFMIGAVSTTPSSTTDGSSMPIGRPPSHSAMNVMPDSSHWPASPTASSSRLYCS